MVLYEVKFSLIPLLDGVLPDIVLSVGFFIFAIKYWIERDKNGLKILSFILVIISLVFFLVLVLNLSDNISTYRKYSSIIKSGEFNTVSGKVERFKPADESGKGEETFFINDVFFSYSNYEDCIGYHKVSTRGGVIKGNGQSLTVNFVYDKYLDRNIILRILENKNQNTSDGTLC